MTTEEAPGGPDPAQPALASHAGSGARWGIVTAVAIQLSTVASTIAAGRILDPEDFAIIGTAAVATALFGLFAQGGFGLSVVTGVREDREAASTYFWGATVVGSVMFVIAALASPLIARLIGSPESASAIAVLSLILPLGLMAEVLQGVQLRQLRFGASSSSDIVTAITTGVLPIVLLLAGLGPWAIILSRVAGTALGVVALLYFGQWRPKWHFDGRLMRAHAGFNTRYLGSSFADYFNKNADYWALGRAVSAPLFGAYYIAYTIPVLVRQRATTMATQIATPILGRVKDDPVRLRISYELIVRVVSSLVVPALVGLSLTADLVLRIAFGPQWSAAVTPLRIIAVAAAIDTVSQCSNSLFLALRQVRLLLRQRIVRGVIFGLCLVSVFVLQTLEAAAWSVLVSVTAGAIFNQISVADLTDTKTRRILVQLFPVFVSTAAMASLVLAVRGAAPDLAIIVEMLVATVAGAVGYLATMALLFRRHLRETIANVRTIAGR